MPDHFPEMDDLTSPTFSQRMVDISRYAMTQRISQFAADRFSLYIQRDPTRFADDLVMRMETALLTEKLPPHTIETRVQYEHPEAVGAVGTTVDARFERPIDHFTAKYRGRWWASLLGLRRRKIRYQFVPVPYLVSRPVQCDHVVTTDVRAVWTYPKPTMVLPAEDFGPVVLDASRVDERARPTTQFADMVRGHARLNGDQRW
jgi:hypothetical protein